MRFFFSAVRHETNTMQIMFKIWVMLFKSRLYLAPAFRHVATVVRGGVVGLPKLVLAPQEKFQGGHNYYMNIPYLLLNRKIQYCFEKCSC